MTAQARNHCDCPGSAARKYRSQKKREQGMSSLTALRILAGAIHACQLGILFNRGPNPAWRPRSRICGQAGNWTAGKAPLRSVAVGQSYFRLVYWPREAGRIPISSSGSR